MELEVIIASHRGLEREHNEDSAGINGWSVHGDEPTTIALSFPVGTPLTVAVCDGMGGHAGGATASASAAEAVTRIAGGAGHTEESLRQLIQAAADSINSISESSGELRGLGTTLVGVHVSQDASAYVFNVGDSRGYRLETGFLGQLTVDHRIEATNRLTQALGGGRRVILDPDFFPCRIDDDATGILLCSDGLTDYVDETAIETEMNASSGRSLPDRLVELALAGGGGDNVTVVQVRMRNLCAELHQDSMVTTTNPKRITDG